MVFQKTPLAEDGREPEGLGVYGRVIGCRARLQAGRAFRMERKF
jgi:hypothetical protein